MKNLIFILVLAIGLLSFTTSSKTINVNQPKKELSVEKFNEDDFPCCVRECFVGLGERYCGPWICGDCVIIMQ
jgi:hypothetical protein